MSHVPMVIKRGLRRIRHAARQLLAFVACAALVLQSTPIPATAQGFGLGGLGGGTQQPGESSGLIPLPFGQNAPSPDTVQPAEVDADPASPDVLALNAEVRHSVERLRGFARGHRENTSQPRPDTPEAFLDFVRSDIGIALYPGVLKGTRGVLSEGVGSSLEIALMGAAILEETGYPVRIGMRTLSDGEAAGIVDSIVEHNSGRSLPPTAPFSQFYSIVNFIGETLLSQVQDLRQPVQSPGATASTVNAQSLQQHWWLEVEASGHWVPVDPLGIASGDVGEARYITPSEAADSKAVWIDVSLLLEAAGGPEAGVHTLASFSRRASGTIGRTVLIRHVPLGVGKLEADAPMSNMLEQISAARAWIPIVSVDGEEIPAKLFYLDGRVRENTEASLLAAQGAKDAGLSGGQAAAVEDLGSSLLGAITPGASAGSEIAGQVVRVWVEIAVRSPYGKESTYQRDVLDIRDSGSASADEEQALALLSSRSFHLDTYRVSPREFLERTVELTDRAEAALDEPAEKRGIPSRALFDATLAHRYQLARWGWRSPSTLFVDRVQITSVFQNITRGDADWFRFESGFDIIENGVDVLPGASTDDPFSERLKQGVADTVAEITRVEGLDTLLNTAVAERARLETAGSHKVEMAESIGGRQIHVFAVNGLTGDRANTWWRIDPTTGQTLGVDARGQGAVKIEYIIAAGLTIAGIFFIAYNLYDCLHARELSGRAGEIKDDVNRALTGMEEPPDVVGLMAPGVNALCGDGKDVAYRIPIVNPDGLELDSFNREALCAGEASGLIAIEAALEVLGTAIVAAATGLRTLKGLGDDALGALDDTFGTFETADDLVRDAIPHVDDTVQQIEDAATGAARSGNSAHPGGFPGARAGRDGPLTIGEDGLPIQIDFSNGEVKPPFRSLVEAESEAERLTGQGLDPHVLEVEVYEDNQLVGRWFEVSEGGHGDRMRIANSRIGDTEQKALARIEPRMNANTEVRMVSHRNRRPCTAGFGMGSCDEVMENFAYAMDGRNADTDFSIVYETTDGLIEYPRTHVTRAEREANAMCHAEDAADEAMTSD